MRRHKVVFNDCATPALPAIRHVRSRNTPHGSKNFTLRIDELVKGLPAQLDATQQDWIEILGHLFAIDMACPRGEGDVDWSRSIEAWMPVRDPAFWQGHRVELEGIWTDLTDDELRLHFELDPTPPAAPRMGQTPFSDYDCVALVSGGQDSFAGVLDLLDAGRKPLMLSVRLDRRPAMAGVDRMTIEEVVKKVLLDDHADVIRESVRWMVQEMMDAEVSDLIGAERGERNPDGRATHRNGYRPRRWDTRAGEIELQIPKLRQGSYFPSFLTPRKRSEQALVAVVQQAYVCGVSTRRVDQLVESLGLRISKP